MIMREKTNFKKSIVSFAVLSVAESFLVKVIGMINAIIIGRTGTAELSGVSIANTVIYVYQALAMSIGLGCTVIMSRNADDKNEIAFNGMIIGAIYSAAAFFICRVGSEAMISLLFGKKLETVKNIAVDYLSFFSYIVPFTAFDMILSGILRGVKNEKAPFAVTLVTNCLNVALCITFITFCDFGYMSGAYALMISTVVSAAVKLFTVTIGKFGLKIFSEPKIKYGICKNVISVSLPSMIEQIFIQNGFLGMQAVTAMLGDVTLAGYQAVNNILNLMYSLTKGIETTEVSFVGAAAGARDYKAAKDGAYKLTYVSEAIMIALTVIVFAFAKFFCGIFVTDLNALEVSVGMMRLMCVTVPFTTLFQCIQGALKTCRDIKFVAVMNALCTWGIKIPLSYVLVKFTRLGFTGMFIGFFTDYAIRAVAFYIRARKENWYPETVENGAQAA